MHPVFLYFSDPEVELGYVSHQAESFLAAMDGNFVALSFLLFGVAASCKAWQGELGLAKELAVAFLPVAMQGLLIRMGMWRKWRTPLAVTIRMIRTALFSGAAKVCGSGLYQVPRENVADVLCILMDCKKGRCCFVQ